jgi:hypothetical protein
MEPQGNERFLELCEKAAQEMDQEKLMELIREISALLEKKERTPRNSEGFRSLSP